MADQDLSERIGLASDRTALANERTLAAWWRTAMSALALGLALAKLFGDVRPAWLVRTGATLLVLLGVIILWTALRTFQRTARNIKPAHVSLVSQRTLWSGTVLLAVFAGVIVAAVWLT